MLFFFFHDTATTEIYTFGHTLSLHDALPIYRKGHKYSNTKKRNRPAGKSPAFVFVLFSCRFRFFRFVFVLPQNPAFICDNPACAKFPARRPAAAWRWFRPRHRRTGPTGDRKGVG